MKYKIEKNTVQETLILPLYSRKLCTELYPNLYRDETAVHLIDQIDYDFSQAEENSRSLMQRFGALEVAMRQNDLAFEVRAYLKNHPCAAVVNLGCGLDNTGRACDNGRCKIYNLDFPDVIALRQQLLPAGEREQNIPCGVFQVAGDVLLPLESYILTDGECPISNSNRELQGGGVYTRYVLTAVIKGEGAADDKTDIDPATLQLTVTVADWELTINQDVTFE